MIVEVQEDENGPYIIFPDELVERFGLEKDDDVHVEIDDNQVMSMTFFRDGKQLIPKDE